MEWRMELKGKKHSKRNVIRGMEEGEKKERRRKGIELGGKKVYTLAYTDNVVLLANNEGEMRSMMGRLEEYLKSKRLMLNTKKKKIIRFTQEERMKKRERKTNEKKVRKSKSGAVYR